MSTFPAKTIVGLGPYKEYHKESLDYCGNPSYQHQLINKCGGVHGGDPGLLGLLCIKEDTTLDPNWKNCMNNKEDEIRNRSNESPIDFLGNLIDNYEGQQNNNQNDNNQDNDDDNQDNDDDNQYDDNIIDDNNNDDYINNYIHVPNPWNYHKSNTFVPAQDVPNDANYPITWDHAGHSYILFKNKTWTLDGEIQYSKLYNVQSSAVTFPKGYIWWDDYPSYFFNYPMYWTDSFGNFITLFKDEWTYLKQDSINSLTRNNNQSIPPIIPPDAVIWSELGRNYFDNDNDENNIDDDEDENEYDPNDNDLDGDLDHDMNVNDVSGDNQIIDDNDIDIDDEAINVSDEQNKELKEINNELKEIKRELRENDNNDIKGLQKFEIGLGILTSVLVIGGIIIYNK